MTEAATSAHAGRGMALAFGAAAGTAAGLVPFKLAADQAEPEYIVVALLASAAVFNTLGSLVPVARRRADRRRGSTIDEAEAADGTLLESAGGLGEVDLETSEPHARDRRRSSLRVTLWVGLVLGVLAATANFTASEAVSQLDASVSAVLIQMQVLFAALLGWLWLHEGVTRRFVVGAVMAIVGVAVIQGGGAGSGAGSGASVWGLVAAACFGTMQVVTRRYIEQIEPVWVNALRLWIAVVLVASVPGSLSGALELSAEVVLLAAAAAFCGPFLGRLMMMLSARYIPAATSTLIGLSSPVLALLGDWLFLDGLPAARQWLGGAVVVAGMLLAVAPAARRSGSSAAQPVGGE